MVLKVKIPFLINSWCSSVLSKDSVLDHQDEMKPPCGTAARQQKQAAGIDQIIW